MTMLAELKNRGIVDALLECCGGLKGLPNAIRVTWPDTTVKACVVHMVQLVASRVEETLVGDHPPDARFLYRADRQPCPRTLRRVRGHLARQLPGGDDQELGSVRGASSSRLLEFAVEPGKIAHTATRSTASTRGRGGVRHREHFPNEQAALNMLYLVATQRRPNRENPSGEIQRLDELAESADCQLSRLHHRNEQMTITAALYQESDSSVPRGLQGRRANVTGSRRTWAWSTFSL
jgi:transposase-like protein